MSENSVLNEQEAKFCLLYVNASAPLMGNARKCYQSVYGNTIDDAVALQKAKELLKKEAVKKRIEELNDYNTHTAAEIRISNTETLIAIRDECSSLKETKNRFGEVIHPTSARSVAVAAIKELNSMYGIKEEIAHKVQIEGADGEGITFNLIVPEKEKVDEKKILEGE